MLTLPLTSTYSYLSNLLYELDHKANKRLKITPVSTFCQKEYLQTILKNKLQF